MWGSNINPQEIRWTCASSVWPRPKPAVTLLWKRFNKVDFPSRCVPTPVTTDTGSDTWARASNVEVTGTKHEWSADGLSNWKTCLAFRCDVCKQSIYLLIYLHRLMKQGIAWISFIRTINFHFSHISLLSKLSCRCACAVQMNGIVLMNWVLPYTHGKTKRKMR